MLALEAGARTSRRMDTFYGVVLPAVPGQINEADYRGLVLHAAVYGLVLGPSGARLVDESEGAVPLAHAIAGVGRALFVVSPAMVQAADDTLGSDLAHSLRASAERGSRFASVTTTADVPGVAAGWGYDAAGVRASLAGYHAAIEADAPLEPARRRHRHRLDGTLLVVEVQERR